MQTTAKQSFDRDGYVIIKQLYTLEEVCKLKEEAAAILAGHNVEKLGVHLGLASESPLFKQAAAKPALVTVLKEVIGDHVIFLNDKIVYKNASTDFGSPWHQDHPYWYGSHKYSVWIALDDATRDNGCLQVIPGSHLLGKLSHDADTTGEEGFINQMLESAIDRTKIIDLPASRGDAIVFHDLLLHASHPNESGADRWALISTYKDGRLEDPEYFWSKAPFAV